MKIKRRWKAMSVLPMLWIIIGLTFAIPYFEHGYEAWIETYYDSLLIMGGWFLGTILGVLMFSGAIDAEEREKKQWKFQDDVFEHYDWSFSRMAIDHDRQEEDAINKTAIHFDISPSEVRKIIKLYEGGE